MPILFIIASALILLGLKKKQEQATNASQSATETGPLQPPYTMQIPPAGSVQESNAMKNLQLTTTALKATPLGPVLVVGEQLRGPITSIGNALSDAIFGKGNAKLDIAGAQTTGTVWGNLVPK